MVTMEEKIVGSAQTIRSLLDRVDLTWTDMKHAIREEVAEIEKALEQGDD